MGCAVKNLSPGAGVGFGINSSPPETRSGVNGYISPAVFGSEERGNISLAVFGTGRILNNAFENTSTATTVKSAVAAIGT